MASIVLAFIVIAGLSTSALSGGDAANAPVGAGRSGLYGTPDPTRVKILDGSGSTWKVFDKAPFPELKDIPFGKGHVLIYRHGELPDIVEFDGKTANRIPWKKDETVSAVEVIRCDSHEREIMHLEARGATIPGPMAPFGMHLYAVAETDEKGSALFKLPSGEYTLVEPSGKFIFIDGTLKIPDKGKKVAALPAQRVEVKITDEKGRAADDCRTFLSITAEPYGRSCQQFQESKSITGGGFSYDFPLKGKASARVWCKGLLPFTTDTNLLGQGPILYLEGERAGAIRGEIKDEEGKPMADFPLGLYRKNGLLPLTTTKTDANGTFTFQPLKSGQYLLTDSVKGTPKELNVGQSNKTIPVPGAPNFKAAIVLPGYEFMALDPPSGTSVEKDIELDKGEILDLSLEVGKEYLWEGSVAEPSGPPLADVEIECDGMETVTGQTGEFSVTTRSPRVKKCTFRKQGYSIFMLKDILVDDAPPVVHMSGLSPFSAELHFPDTGSLPPPPEIKFFKESQPVKPKLMLAINTEGGSVSLGLRSELESGTYTLSVKGPGLKPFLSRPFTVTAVQAFDYGVVELELGGGEGDETEKCSPITIRFTDKTDVPVPDIHVAVQYLKDRTRDPGVTAQSTKENGCITMEGAEEITAAYAEGSRGFISLSGPALAPCNLNRSCSFVLTPANRLSITIKSMDAASETFDIMLVSGGGVGHQQVNKGEEAVFNNLVSPVDLHISSAGEELFGTVIHLSDGDNVLVL